ncbi:MAG: hypothetical protein Q9160_000708 [Pyrenula sp. 1 TL-2023]
MSTHGSSSNPRNSTNATEVYDQPIKLIDTTKPAENSDSENEGQRLSSDSKWRRLAKKPTNFSVREELARRKYAKWQQDKPGESTNTTGPQEAPSGNQGPSSSQGVPEPTTPSQSKVQEADFADSTNLQERGRSPSRRAETARAKARKHHHHHQASHVDILYENQRGTFFFGVPLYSHSSLLNFDPAPWVTSTFKDSPVNITNAQVPDPSWEWAWKSWYVDMSYDVDEEGWQYSFSFARKFSWHGTHPWLHSFVRRRRWLRKRVRCPEVKAEGGTMDAAHMLTSEYFTIHPKRDRSVSTDRDGSVRYSFMTFSTAEDILLPEEITDVASLLKSLRLATIDREKLDAIRKFMKTANIDELSLLHEHVPAIMSFFVFQNSGRQLVAILKQAISDPDSSRNREDEFGSKTDSKDVQNRIDSIHKALSTAETRIGGLEYWNDKTRSNSLRTSDEQENKKPTIEDSKAKAPENDPVGRIRGIPEKADIGIDYTKGAASPTIPAGKDYDGGADAKDEKENEQVKKMGANRNNGNDARDDAQRPSSMREEIGKQGEMERKDTMVVSD